MAVATYFRPNDIDPGEVDGVVVADPRLAVVGFTGGSFLRFEGRFDYTSEETLDASPVTAITFSDDLDGLEPSLAITRVKALFGDFLGDAGLDVTVFSGNDRIQGSDGDDDLLGLAGAGNDLVDGGAGNDAIDGGEGRDKLYGGDGQDLLASRSDPDKLTGGADADLFILAGGSAGTKITDFNKAEGDQLGLDLNEVFDGADPEEDDPSLFIELRGNDKKVTLYIDADGGGDQFVKWASIKGDLGTDLDQLIADGVVGVL